MTVSGVGRMRLRMLLVTVAAAVAVLFLMPVSGEDSDPPRCTSPFASLNTLPCSRVIAVASAS